MKQSELSQLIYRHMSGGYFLDSTGKLSFRVRAEKAAAEILHIQREEERSTRSRSVKVQPRREAAHAD